MTKPELGTKRLCGSCGAKFYDLGKNPIVCPKCGTIFEVVVPVARSRPDAKAAQPAKEEAAEVGAPETQDIELVSLEDADAEAQGKTKVTGDDAVVGTDDDVEVADDDTMDDTFIEETEEGDDDVTDIIGDVDDKEES